MATLTSVRNALYNKIWNSGISRSVTIKTLSSSSVSDHGEAYAKTYTDATSKAVPYNTFSTSRSYLQWGEPTDGASDIALPYDATIDQDSLIVDDGVTYKIINIEKFPFGSGSVATVARIVEAV